MMDGSNAWLVPLISGTSGWWHPLPAGQVRALLEPEGHPRISILQNQVWDWGQQHSDNETNRLQFWAKMSALNYAGQA